MVFALSIIMPHHTDEQQRCKKRASALITVRAQCNYLGILPYYSNQYFVVLGVLLLFDNRYFDASFALGICHICIFTQISLIFIYFHSPHVLF